MRFDTRTIEDLHDHIYESGVGFDPDAFASIGCDGSLRHTREWASRTGRDPEAVVALVQGRGGFCDCEVLGNVQSEDVVAA